MKTIVHALAAFAGAVAGILIISNLALSKSTEEPEVELENSSNVDTVSKYYFSVLGIKAKGAREYTSVTYIVKGLYPSEDNIEQVRQKAIAHNPDFKDCVVLSYMPISM